jgi:hypothetical protein
MTVSGVTKTNSTRDTIIYGALRKVGAYATGGVPKSHQVTDANTALNLMIKAWQIQNFLWIHQFVTIFQAKGQTSYDFPGSKGAVSYSETALDGALSEDDTVITVDSSTGMAAEDTFGVILSDGSIHWDTIVTVDSTTQVTITDGVAGGTSNNAIVYSYNAVNALYRPTRIFQVQRLDTLGSDIEIDSMGRDDYARQVNKTAEGTITQYYYDAQLSTGVLYVWQPSSDNAGKLVLDVDRPLSIMIDSADTYDFPEEWIEVILYGLAVRISPEYMVPMGERNSLIQTFSSMVSNLLDYDVEHTSLYLGADNHG